MNRNIASFVLQLIEPEPLQLLEPLPLSVHPACVYLSQLSERSRDTMRRHLNAIARLLTGNRCDYLNLDWAKLRYQHTALLRTELPRTFAASTVNQMLSALKQVLSEARKLHLMSLEDYTDAVTLKPMKTSSQLKGRLLSSLEMQALMSVCLADLSLIGKRDAALVAILLGTGMRRAEVVRLNLEDYQPPGTLMIRQGKGSKARTVYLPSSSQPILASWLLVRGNSPGALLMSISKGNHLLGRRMSEQAVLFLLQKRGQDAQIQPFTPHDCRRTFISSLLAAGVDLVTVSQLAGHTSVMTTAKYDRRGEEVKRQAVELLTLPF
ncbi:site-specific integrase [Chroococcus sp. FPU101]|uniref:tyrosine-type recombinase/integrase n=1 Tax=Chroococcus sp. FPU101 TaxID=1974212 RepID=UPI001A8C2D86|nr:site-specific integrase [Chroococcus sp. FPU101]